MTLIVFVSQLSAQDSFPKKILSEEYQDSLSNHPLGSISHSYTLTLSKWYPDCGEFGGHLETIELRVSNSNIVAEVNVYKKNCNNEKERKIKNSRLYNLKESDVGLVIQYLQELQKKTLSFNAIGHSGCIFRARLGFSEANEVAERLTRLNLNYFDNYCNWAEFEQLKSNLTK